MSDRFHVNCSLAPGPVVLQGPEAHHLAVVCRLRPGDAVCLFNGDGREYPGRVVEITRRAVTVEVLSVSTPLRELPWRLDIAAPLPKGDRGQFLVEKLTELGVQRLTLLVTDRSVVHPRETRVEKLHRHVIEASKQCGRNTLMQVEGPIAFATFVRDPTLPDCRLLAHPLGEARGASWPRPGTPVVAMVGPEGGFTDDEIHAALAAGWLPIDLGPRILRIETAAMALAARLILTSAPADAAAPP
jgi:16S rRNA (uracil1498-N3)-methyltransferase